MSDISVVATETVKTEAAKGRRGFSSWEGKPFPVCFLRERKDGTKPTKEEAYKAFEANERGEKSSFRSEVISGEANVREGQEMEQGNSVGFVEIDENAEAAIVQPTDDFLGIKWRMWADQYNIVLVADKKSTFHPTIEMAFEKLRRLAENRLLGENQSTCSFTKLKEIGVKVQMEFQKMFSETLNPKSPLG